MPTYEGVSFPDVSKKKVSPSDLARAYTPPAERVTTPTAPIPPVVSTGPVQPTYNPYAPVPTQTQTVSAPTPPKWTSPYETAAPTQYSYERIAGEQPAISATQASSRTLSTGRPTQAPTYDLTGTVRPSTAPVTVKPQQDRLQILFPMDAELRQAGLLARPGESSIQATPTGVIDLLKESTAGKILQKVSQYPVSPPQLIPYIFKVLQEPYRKGIEPYIAAAWVDTEKNRSQAERSLETQIKNIDARLAVGSYPPLTDSERQGLRETRDQLRRMRSVLIQQQGQQPSGQGLVQIQAPRRATEQELETWRSEAPWYTQMLAGAVFDPLNYVGFVTGPVNNAVRAARTAKWFSPTAKTGAELLQQTAKAAESTKTVASKFNLVKPTYSAMRNALQTEALDNSMLLINDIASQGNPVEIMSAFVSESDDLAKATQGLTQSAPMRRTAALWRASLGMEGGQQPYGALINIMSKAKTENEAAAQLLQMLDKGVDQVIPRVTAKNPLVRMRDAVKNITSQGVLGYSWTYGVRNASNNLFTAAIDGSVPLARTTTLIDWQKRFGPMPVAGKQGIGSAGMDWGKAADVENWMSSLTDITRFNQLGEGVTLKSPMLTLSGNVERYSSDHIVAASEQRWMDQLWRPTARKTRKDLLALGLPEGTADLLSRKFGNALNKDELWNAVRQVADGGDIGGDLPLYAARDLDKIQPGLANKVNTVLKDVPIGQKDSAIDLMTEVASTAEDAAASVQKLKKVVSDTATRVKRARAQKNAQEFTVGMSDYFAQANAAVRADMLANDARIQRIVSYKGKVPDLTYRDMWSEFKTERKIGIKNLHDVLNNVEDSLLPDFGFTPEEMGIWKSWRKAIDDAWRQSDEIISKAWEATYSGAHTEEELSKIWGEAKTARIAVWDQFNAAEPDFMLQMSQAKQRVIDSWVSGGGKVAKVPGKVQIGDTIDVGGQKYTLKNTPEDRALMDALNAGEQAPVVTEYPAQQIPEAQRPPEPTVTTPGPIEPVTITDDQLRQAASDSGIGTITEKGVPYDNHLVNVINKDLGLSGEQRISKLSDMTPAQKDDALVALTVRSELSSKPEQTVASTFPDYIRVDRRGNTWIKRSNVHVDPKNLQYKLSTDPKTGTGSAFKNVKKWDENAGAGMALWVNPKDNKVYVVNGHHRYEMGVRFNVSEFKNPLFIEAEDVKQARLMGALLNIHDGRGTPIDAGKVFRELGIDLAGIEERGLALTEGNVTKGYALSKLEPTLFQKVIRQQLPIERAVIIGDKIQDTDLQLQFVKMLEDQERKGIRITNDKVLELADQIVNGPKAKITQGTLWGNDEQTISLALQRADVTAYVREQMGRDKRIFAQASKHAEKLEQIGHVDAVEAQKLSKNAAYYQEWFDKVKNMAGTRTSALADEAAERIANGAKLEAVNKEYFPKFLEAIQQDIDDLFRGGPGGGNVAGLGGTEGAPGMEAPRPPSQEGPGFFDLGDAEEPPPGYNRFSFAFEPVDPSTIAARGSRSTRSILQGLKGKPTEPLPKLTSADVAKVKEYVRKEILGKQIKTKAMVKKLSEQDRHFILGNYADRRNFDEMMSWAFPWAYWYRFTYWNWTKRILRRPGVLSNYLRYQEILDRENLAWYREETGDPNAELPPEIKGRIRIPIAGTNMWFDMESALNPLKALTTTFSTRARRTASVPWAKDVPEEQRKWWQQGEFIEKITDYGPSLYPELIWAYSLWLKSIGESEAADQFTSYFWSGTPIIKGATALIREKVPETAGVIPPGGVNVEGWFNPFVKGGDIWSRNRVGLFLYNLMKNGEITETEFQNAANAKSGPVWDRAVQMEAVAMAPGKLFSYLSGIGARPYGIDQAVEDQMWADYFEVWDQYDQVSYSAWRDLMDEFDEKYPWASGYMLARETDPVQATSDYTRLVDQRMPPGNQRVQTYKDAGMWDLMQKFYSIGGSNPLSQFTEEEYNRFKEGIEKLGATVQVPNTSQTEAWTQAKRAHEWMLDQAYGLVQQQGYWIMPWELEAQQDAYFASDNPEQFMTDHPALQAWWDAQGTIQDRYPAVKALEQKYYDSPETVAKSNFWDAVPPGYNWQKNTDVPAVVKMMLDENTRGSMTPEQIQEATTWLKENVPAQYANTDEWEQARTENDQYKAEQLRLFGSDLVELNRKYGAMTDEERELFRLSNPEQFNRLKSVWDFKKTWAAGHPIWNKYYGYGDTDTGDGSSSYPVTAEAQKAYDDNAAFKTEATQRFGSDILDVARTYASLSDAARAQFRVDRAADYQRLKGYWDFKREYGTTHPEWQRYYGFPDTGTTYSGGGGYSGGYRSWGGYSGGTTPTTTTTQPTAPTVVTPAAWESWSAVQFNDNIKPFMAADSTWKALVSAMFGPNIWGILSQWFAMTAEQRAAWKEAHPDLWALIQKFMSWFLTQKPGATSSKRVLESIPKSAPIVPPVAAETKSPAET